MARVVAVLAFFVTVLSTASVVVTLDFALKKTSREERRRSWEARRQAIAASIAQVCLAAQEVLPEACVADFVLDGQTTSCRGGYSLAFSALCAAELSERELRAMFLTKNGVIGEGASAPAASRGGVAGKIGRLTFFSFRTSGEKEERFFFVGYDPMSGKAGIVFGKGPHTNEDQLFIEGLENRTIAYLVSGPSSLLVREGWETRLLSCRPRVGDERTEARSPKGNGNGAP